jgi:predicted ATPase with chaperone activity
MSGFPFSAIVGQEEMKLALLVAAVDARIGGVMIFGDRGTGKSNAARALAATLPQIRAVDGCQRILAISKHISVQSISGRCWSFQRWLSSHWLAISPGSQ